MGGSGVERTEISFFHITVGVPSAIHVSCVILIPIYIVVLDVLTLLFNILINTTGMIHLNKFQ